MLASFLHYALHCFRGSRCGIEAGLVCYVFVSVFDAVCVE